MQEHSRLPEKKKKNLDIYLLIFIFFWGNFLDGNIKTWPIGQTKSMFAQTYLQKPLFSLYL